MANIPLELQGAADFSNLYHAEESRKFIESVPVAENESVLLRNIRGHFGMLIQNLLVLEAAAASVDLNSAKDFRFAIAYAKWSYESTMQAATGVQVPGSIQVLDTDEVTASGWIQERNRRLTEVQQTQETIRKNGF